MHHIYDDTFGNGTNKYMKVIVGNRNRCDAQKKLIRKRSKQFRLKHQTQKSKFRIATHMSSTKSTFVFFHPLISKETKELKT
jgi:hypothetical protein